MTTPLGDLEIGPRDGRRVTVARSTRETSITVTLGLDGSGTTSVDTGIGFYDHLLGSLAHHGLFDLAVNADGDLQIELQHGATTVILIDNVCGSQDNFSNTILDLLRIAKTGVSY